MSTNETKALISQFYEQVWNQGNLDGIDALCAAGFCHYDGVGRDTHDLDAFKHYVAATHAAFPDLELTLGELIAEGAQVAVHWTLRGTHLGTCLGIEPTGRRVELEGVSLYRVAGERIVESSVFRDRLDLQLGCRVVRPSAEGD